MKNLVMTASVVAVGLVSLSTAQAQRQDKPWSVSASVRGFYDDNIGTTPSNPIPGTPGAQDSFGIQFRPSASYYINTGSTTFDLSYALDVKYYEDRSDSTDFQHDVNLAFTHAFSEIHRLSVTENFVSAQDAELVEAGTVFRSLGDNIRNTFRVAHEAELSRLISVELSYRNTYVDYQQDESNVRGPFGGGDNGFGSYSSLLDRWEHRFGTDVRWQVQPQTRALVGYQFGVVTQNSDTPIAGPSAANPAQRLILPEERDSRSHYFFVGGDHNFTPQLSTAVRVGAQYTEYPNSAAGAQNSVVSPYGDASLSYEYRENSSITFGIRHERNQTDIALTGGSANPTLDAQNTTLYGTLSHAITAKLTGGLSGRFRHSRFEDGGANGSTENYFIFGSTLEYAINTFLTAEAGYSFTRLDSDISNRAFSRNRVYIGMRATY